MTDRTKGRGRKAAQPDVIDFYAHGHGSHRGDEIEAALK